MISRRWFRFASVVFMLFWLSGCTTDPAPDAGFIDGSKVTQKPDLPFQKAWSKEGVNWKQYTGIYVAPVNSSYALKTGSWKTVAKYGTAEEDLQKEGNYMREVFIKAFKEDPHHRYQVVDTPSQGDIILEMAIVELVPNSPAMKAASYAPIVGTAFTVINMADSDSVAFEARICDGATGEVIAMAGDRRQAKKSLVNVKDFTWYGHADAIMKDWAKEFVAIANRQPGQIVKKASGFQLKPW